jgi:hypothetical protein
MTTLPGFTAEVSLNTARDNYHALSRASTGAGDAAVRPQRLHATSTCAYWDVCCTDHPNPVSAMHCCRKYYAYCQG